MLIKGEFDDSGSPTIRITIAGNDASKEYVAVIDTGFTGFVALNLHEMIPLNLTVDGAASVTLGDGSTVEDLIARGSVILGDRNVDGTIDLSATGNEVLIGLEFLRAFRLSLILTPTVCVLYDEVETLEAVMLLMSGAPAGAPDSAPTWKQE